MKVQELIELLKHVEPNAEVFVWDPYNDVETTVVKVSAFAGHGNAVMIADDNFGEEVK